MTPARAGTTILAGSRSRCPRDDPRSRGDDADITLSDCSEVG